MLLKNFFKPIFKCLSFSVNSNGFIYNAGLVYNDGTDVDPVSYTGYSYYSGQQILKTVNSFVYQSKLEGPCPRRLFNGSLIFDGVSSSSSSYPQCCAFFGDGDTPVTIDDIKLSGNIITGFSATTSLHADDTEIIATYVVTNNTASPMTIREIGLCGTTGNSTKYLLVERSVLETPVTINPGETKTIVYRISAS